MANSIKSSNLLDSIIKFLIILLLLGVLFLVYIFAKDKVKNEDSVNITNVKEKIIQPELKKEIIEKPSGKVYSQDEMQEIVQMMMDQMQELNKSKYNESEKLAINTTTDSELIDTLQDTDIEDDVAIKSDTLSEEIKATKLEDKVDHYNKVVVNNSNYSKTNLDALTQKIGDIVDDMSAHKITKTTYTQNISKEVTTRVDESRVIIVKKGDTLSKIALRAYGKVSSYHKLVEANRDLIKNPNHIYVGQRLRVPTL